MTYKTSKSLCYTASLPILFIFFNSTGSSLCRMSDTELIIAGIFATVYLVFVIWLENYYRNRCTIKVIAQLDYVRTFDTVNYTRRGGGGPGMSGHKLSENRLNRWFTRYKYVVDGKEYYSQKSYYSDKVMYSYVEYPQIFSRERWHV